MNLWNHYFVISIWNSVLTYCGLVMPPAAWQHRLVSSNKLLPSDTKPFPKISKDQYNELNQLVYAKKEQQNESYRKLCHSFMKINQVHYHTQN